MVTIFLGYLYWHFTVAPFEILKIMKNYMIATWHQFLIVQHLNTLFSPWHRQNPSDIGPKSKTFVDKIMDLITDIYIRLIAACIRLTIILIGLIVELLILVAFLILFIVWLAWPAIAVYSISRGLNLVTQTYGI